MNIQEIRPAVNQNAVDLARQLLAACEAGEVIEFCGVQIERGGTHTTIATETESKLRVVGALMRAVVDRLGD